MNELRFLGLAHNAIRSIDFLGDCLELRCLILNNNQSESSNSNVSHPSNFGPLDANEAQAGF